MNNPNLIHEWVLEEAIKTALVGLVKDGSVSPNEAVQIATSVLNKLLVEFKGGEGNER